MVILDSLRASFDMLWETLWALIVGFTLSGLVQAFVSRERMQRSLGGHDAGSITRAGFFGAVSSSCSYAASALAKTLFARGADFTAALVFMFASTNLVLELGIVLWLLMGWQFALAEVIGGVIMIILFTALSPRVFPQRELDAARARLNSEDEPIEAPNCHGTEAPAAVRKPTLRDAIGYTLADLKMLRKELVIGYLVAGAIQELVPDDFFADIFASGHGWLTEVWQVILGPFIAIVSFVCSVGNVPLASALYGNGLSFGGTIAFIFADLITLPLLLVYRRLYGTRMMFKMLGLFWLVMSVAGLLTERLFKLLDYSLPHQHGHVEHSTFGWDYKTVMNAVAIVGLAALVLRARSAAPAEATESPFATDPICGMQVDRANPGAQGRTLDGVMHYFCCDGCKTKFLAQHASG